jgi:GNAT superfamily N-acetyltransferase
MTERSSVLLASHAVQRLDNLLLVRVYPVNVQQSSDDVDDDDDEEDRVAAETNYRTIVPFSSDTVSGWVDETCEQLQQQWPTEDGASQYRNQTIHHTSSPTRYDLACSYLLLEQPSREAPWHVIGSGRLTECFESSGGNAAAATYILVFPHFQGRGHGRRLMKMQEEEAKRLGYHYVYLWTRAAVDFYEKIGYQTSHRVSLKRPCLKTLSATNVQSLEQVLLKRNKAFGNCETNDKTKKLETVTLLPKSPSDGSTAGKEEDVWLRKRLLEHVGSTLVPPTERQQEIQLYMENLFQRPDNAPSTSCAAICYRWNPNVAWQQQIGPSCGLVAIRMIRDYYYSLCEAKSDPSDKAVPSLLAKAQESGYTQDGELFDAEHLSELLHRQIGNFECQQFSSLQVKTRDFDNVSLVELDATLQQGGFWVIPYDSNPRTKLPAKLQGKHAHWGIVVGILYAGKNLSLPKDDCELSCMQLKNEQTPFDLGESMEKDCFLCVQHSLWSQWAIAPFNEWKASNYQLTSMDDYKFTLSPTNLNLQNRIIQVTCA